MKRRRRDLPRLDPDLVGRLGENRFRDLCDRAGLECSKPVPDRTGKDFVVEFPLAAFDAMLSYDRRPAPLQVIVQVKTVTGVDRPIVLSLSAAERLVRDARPAVICAFVYDPDGEELTEMRFVHLLGDNLARVLRGLRQAQKNDRKPLHRSTVSFRLEVGYRVEMAKDTLSEALRSLAPDGMDGYGVGKRRELATTGYGADRLTGKLTFSSLSEADLVDAFLGLKAVPAQTFGLTERRFGIDLPLPEATNAFAGGMVTFEPEPIGSCTLRLSTSATGGTSTVPARTFVVPAGLVGSDPTYMFEWAMGRLRIDVRDRNCNVVLQPDVDGVRSIGEWKDEFGFLDRIFCGPGQLRVERDGVTMDVVSVDWPTTERPRNLARHVELLDAYETVLRHAGVGETKVTLDDLSKDRKTASVLCAMLSNHVKLTTESEAWDIPDMQDAKGLFVTAATLAGTRIGIAIPMTVTNLRTPAGLEWTCYKRARPTFQVLRGDAEAALADFHRNATALAEPDCCLLQRQGDLTAPGDMTLELILKDD